MKKEKVQNRIQLRTRNTSRILILFILIFSAVGVIPPTFASGVGIKNAGFETGDFSYWTSYVPSGGSVHVVTSHSGDRGVHYTPVTGDHFARLKTNGPGSYTSLKQTFSIAAGQTIGGWAAFDSRDYNPFMDNAMVRILDGSGNQVARPWYSDVSQVGDYGDGPWTYWSWTAGSSGT